MTELRPRVWCLPFLGHRHVFTVYITSVTGSIVDISLPHKFGVVWRFRWNQAAGLGQWFTFPLAVTLDQVISCYAVI